MAYINLSTYFHISYILDKLCPDRQTQIAMEGEPLVKVFRYLVKSFVVHDARGEKEDHEYIEREKQFYYRVRSGLSSLVCPSVIFLCAGFVSHSKMHQLAHVANLVFIIYF